MAFNKRTLMLTGVSLSLACWNVAHAQVPVPGVSPHAGMKSTSLGVTQQKFSNSLLIKPMGASDNGEVVSPASQTKPLLKPTSRSKLQDKVKRETTAAARPTTIGTAACICHEAARESAAGHHARALVLFKKFVAQVSREYGPESYDMAHYMQNVGMAYNDLNQYKESAAVYKQAIALCTKHGWDESIAMAEALDGLSTAQCNMRQYAEAAITSSRAIAVAQKDGSDRGLVANCFFERGYIADCMKPNSDEALRYYQQASQIYKDLKQNDNLAFMLQGNIGNIFVNRHQYRAAEQVYKNRIALLNQSKDAFSNNYIDAVDTLAKVYVKTNQSAKAHDLYRQFRNGTLFTNAPKTARQGIRTT